MASTTNGIATHTEAAGKSGMSGVTSVQLVTKTKLPDFFCKIKDNPSQDYSILQCVKYEDIVADVFHFSIINALTGEAISSDSVEIKIDGTTQTYTRSNNVYTIANLFLQQFTITITYTGYRVYNASVTFSTMNNNTAALIPESSDAEFIAYVNWNHDNSQGESLDYDIDTHVVVFGPDTDSSSPTYGTIVRKGEVSYKGFTYEDDHIKVHLDIDDTGSDHGETVTVFPKTPEGGTSLYSDYVLYYVQYDFEHYSSPVTNPFAERETVVRAIDKNDLVTTFTPPLDQVTTKFWHLFTIVNSVIPSGGVVNEVDVSNTGNWELKEGLGS